MADMSQAAVKFESLDPSCGTCRYWKREDGEEWGTCRRMPPVASVAIDEAGSHALMSLQPQTDAGDWCGEFGAGQ